MVSEMLSDLGKVKGNMILKQRCQFSSYCDKYSITSSFIKNGLRSNLMQEK